MIGIFVLLTRENLSAAGLRTDALQMRAPMSCTLERIDTFCVQSVLRERPV